MSLVQEQAGDVTVVRPEGRIDGVSAAQFQAELLDIINGAQLVVIDGSSINYVSSAGLRAFLIAAKTAHPTNALIQGFVIFAINVMSTLAPSCTSSPSPRAR